MIFFREQKLDAERHKAFTRRFGKLFIHPNYVGMQSDPEIIVITREPGDKRIVGEEWHADTTMVREPPMGAILYAVEVPPYGGDTLFANQYLAYKSLSGLRSTWPPGHMTMGSCPGSRSKRSISAFASASVSGLSLWSGGRCATGTPAIEGHPRSRHGRQ